MIKKLGEWGYYIEEWKIRERKDPNWTSRDENCNVWGKNYAKRLNSLTVYYTVP